MPLRDASHFIARGNIHLPAERAAEATPRLFWQSPSDLGAALAAQTGPEGIAVEVYVNEGRWIVECPDCHGAQLAARDDRRYMCNECANVAVDGLWRPVVWPTDPTAIDVELDKRPTVNANWLPGESVADLRRENVAHGIG